MSGQGANDSAAAERSSILIVDDLPEQRLVLETILGDLGQDLVFANSGSEALREVLRREFAVILLDVNMPDIDGFETATLIRRYKRSAHTPIIFVTAYADEIQTARGYSLGAVDYILAPVVPEVLRSRSKSSWTSTSCSGRCVARPMNKSHWPLLKLPRSRRTKHVAFELPVRCEPCAERFARH